jgi:hypothetical protein
MTELRTVEQFTKLGGVGDIPDGIYVRAKDYNHDLSDVKAELTEIKEMLTFSMQDRNKQKDRAEKV